MAANRYRMRGVVLGALVLMCLTLAGCIEAKVQVRLEADGSGTRRVEMVWQQGTLEDLELTTDDVRALLNLSADHGWTVRTEDRPVQGGSLEAHVVFERAVEISSIDEWGAGASDLRMRASSRHPEAVRNRVSVEVGRGAGYRTVDYDERLDGSAVRDLLDRTAAGFLVDEIAEQRPGLDQGQLAELRGLFMGHLAHYDLWVLEDEEVDAAWDALQIHIAPQLANILGRRAVDEDDLDTAQGLLEAISADDDINERLESEFPGVGLLAFMSLKFELVLPGVVVESNADRVGDGYAAWERSVWTAINEPLVFRVHARIPE